MDNDIKRKLKAYEKSLLKEREREEKLNSISQEEINKYKKINKEIYDFKNEYNNKSYKEEINCKIVLNFESDSKYDGLPHLKSYEIKCDCDRLQERIKSILEGGTSYHEDPDNISYFSFYDTETGKKIVEKNGELITKLDNYVKEISKKYKCNKEKMYEIMNKK